VVTVATTKAREFGFDTLACASTGNLANSVAAHAARGGMRAMVFIPANLEQGKIVGAAVYGSTLVAVDGAYDEVNRLCSELADKYPWAFVNINVRPYYSEGSKTLAYEVVEQFGWRAPDHCIVPLASGSLFTKIWKGIKEMAWLGLADWAHTRMSGAQAEGCSPIIAAWDRQTFDIRPVRPNTIAKSLAIGNPADGYYSLKVASTQRLRRGGDRRRDRRFDGSWREQASSPRPAGEWSSPDCGGCGAGALRAGRGGRGVITGAGLKTREAVLDKLTPPLHIEPHVSSFEEAFARRQEAVTAAAEANPRRD
jgi:threonine synthase